MRSLVTTDLLTLRYSEKGTMTAAEWYAFLKTTDVALNELQQAKIDQLNEACEAAILAGFTSSTTGHSYPFGQYDQMNLTQQMLLMLSDQTIESLDWKTTDAGIVTHTRDQFFVVCRDAEAHKRSKIAAYWGLKAQVASTTTPEEVDAITWS